jgi:prepilin-type N-terminal cleavage/methylation domain-containing protein/prepilin-type processing-associated H-X9-DG protein
MSAMVVPLSSPKRPRPRAFSLAELLVVVGIISLLIAIILPPLQLARRKAMQAKCSAQLQQLGHALENARSEYGFYPLWDDGGTAIRYTWIDVLIQRRLLSPLGDHRTDRTREGSAAHVGYCPADGLPDALNAARHNDLIYPSNRSRVGVDYSYGIGVPLSAGGWAWRPGDASDDELRPRVFRSHEEGTSGRVLAGDAYTSAVYNLSGYALSSGIWNAPTQFDNTVAWGRHPALSPDSPSANLLFQDGHVSTVDYARSRSEPVNTARAFVWYPGEPLAVGPADRHEDNWYPNRPPPSYQSTPRGDVFPVEMTPLWYTRTHRWTLITHK